jgi:hypothetical protein
VGEVSEVKQWVQLVGHTVTCVIKSVRVGSLAMDCCCGVTLCVFWFTNFFTSCADFVLFFFIFNSHTFLGSRSQNCEKRLLVSPCPSVHPYGTTLLPLDGFL